MPMAVASLPVILRYVPGGKLGLGDLVLLGKQLGGFAVVVAGLERQRLGLRDGRLLGEFLVDVAQRRLHRPAVEPVDQAEGEHVLAAIDVLGAQARVLGGGGVELVDRDADQAIFLRAIRLPADWLRSRPS